MLEFIDEEHIYLLDGVIIPSVSEILHFIFPNKYKNVPKEILNKKADYGSKVHSAIEMYEINLKAMEHEEALNTTIIALDLIYLQETSLKQYLRLKNKYSIQVEQQEQMIHYKDVYAGRFDMIANIGKEHCLCDIKTTAELDKEYLSWQLSLYAYAYNSLNKKNHFDKLYAIWLPKKDLGRLVEIEFKTDEEIEELLRKYKEFIWKKQEC